MSLRVVVVSVVWAALAATGCAYGEVRQVVRAQFASELDCPEVTITKRDAWYAYDGPHQWKVSGCGVMRTYTCPKIEGRVSYDEPACTWVEGDADAPQINAPKPEDPALEESEDLDAPLPDSATEPEEQDEEEPSGTEPDSEGGEDGSDQGEDGAAHPQGKAGAQKKASAGISGGLRIGTGKKK